MRDFRKNEQETPSEQLVELLTFKTGGATYATDVLSVTDIIELCPITAVPGLPPYMRGIINLRGKIVPIMDLRVRLQTESLERRFVLTDEYPERACIVVVRLDNVSCGLIAEEVCDVEQFAESRLAPNPKKNSFVSHIISAESDIIQKLDCMRLQNVF